MSADPLYRMAISDRMDAALIHEYISTMGLDPRPTESQRPYRLRDNGSVLLVETYDWGRVCVATNRNQCTVTWVEHGGLPPELPGWCILARHRYNSPPCVGRHEDGDSACDGSGRSPKPCVWRALCKAIQKGASRREIEPERHLLEVARATVNATPPSELRRVSEVARPVRVSPVPPTPAPVAATGKPAPRKGVPGDPYVLAVSHDWCLRTMAAVAMNLEKEWGEDREHRTHSGGMFYRKRPKPRLHFAIYTRRGTIAATPKLSYICRLSRRRPGVKLAFNATPAAVEWLRQNLPATIEVKLWKNGGTSEAIVRFYSDENISQVARSLKGLSDLGLWPGIIMEKS